MPEITKEQLAVIEAATGWGKCTYEHGVCKVCHGKLALALDALPKPYQPLMPMQLGPEMRVGAAYLRAAAERFSRGPTEEEMNMSIPERLRDWAFEEEMLSK